MFSQQDAWQYIFHFRYFSDVFYDESVLLGHYAVSKFFWNLIDLIGWCNTFNERYVISGSTVPDQF